MLKRSILALALVGGTLAGSAQSQERRDGSETAAGQGGVQMQLQILQIQRSDPNEVDLQSFQQLNDRGMVPKDPAGQMPTMTLELPQNPLGMTFSVVPQDATLINIRRQLNVTSEDEWNVLSPRIQRVLSAMAEVQQNDGRAMSVGATLVLKTSGDSAAAPEGGAASASADETPIARSWRELCEVMQNVHSTDAEIRAKLANWRTLHRQAVSELEAARMDLVRVLTLRQESILLVNGIL